MRHNPIIQLENIHADFVMAAGMMNMVIEAAMSGDCSPADIGDSLFILKEFTDKRIRTLEEQNGELQELSGFYDMGISDQDILRIYEKQGSGTAEGGQKPENTGYERQLLPMLPEAKREPVLRAIQEAGAASRQQGFLDGFRKAWRMLAEEDAHGG